MRILVVCQYYYPEAFRITDICESLVLSGHDVTVLTGLPNYPEGKVLPAYRWGHKREEIINGVKVLRCFEVGRGSNKIKLFLNYFSYAISATLKVFSMNENFDVVLANQLSPILMAIPAIAYKKKFKKELLLYCLDLWPDSLSAGGIKQGSIIYSIFYKISKWIYKSADLILITSSMFRDYFSDILKIDPANVVHLPQYAEDLFTVKSEVKGFDSQKEKVFHFVFAGNIGDMQSVETIMMAANEIRSDDNLSFHIVGDGSKLDSCKELAENLKLKNVEFYGRKPIEEMPRFYGMADAMLITLKDDKVMSYTLPGKIQSYMAAGKPIIGAINGEAEIVIRKAACGLTCEAENYKAFAKLIKEFCDSDQKEQMGMNARKFYTSNYSKEKFMTSLEAALDHSEA